jgi:hypothetical protein
MKPNCIRIALVLVGAFFAVCANCAEPARTVDLVVYGGTASGVMMAYSAAREGLRVDPLVPGAHLGGMVTCGLSATDLGHFAVIGGYAREFYMKAAAHYGVHELNRAENWLSEPHLDEEICRAMLKDAGVAVSFHERLRENNGVAASGGRIESIITEDGKQWRGAVFADCTYEGDLMAQAHVSYTWGRESANQHGEDLAGVREHKPRHQFGWAVSACDDEHHLLPEIDAGPLAPPGSGDKKVQAYNFRLILTNDAANRLPFPKPQGYDRSRFALLQRNLGSFEQHAGRAPRLRDFFIPVLIPNHKADFNNNGPVSTDYIGHSWKYPEGSYVEKAAIWREHLLYTESLMYFLATDESVPATLRGEMNGWGLPQG